MNMDKFNDLLKLATSSPETEESRSAAVRICRGIERNPKQELIPKKDYDEIVQHHYKYIELSKEKETLMNRYSNLNVRKSRIFIIISMLSMLIIMICSGIIIMTKDDSKKVMLATIIIAINCIVAWLGFIVDGDMKASEISNE